MFVGWAVFGFLYSYWPVIVNLQGMATSLLALLITLVLCQVSWVYFEKPLVRLGHRTDYQFGAGAPPSVLEGGDLSSPEVARP